MYKEHEKGKQWQLFVEMMKGSIAADRVATPSAAWPETETVPSDGSLAREQLMREVGAAMGFGRDEAAWTSKQTSIIGDVVQHGVNGFYAAEPLEEGAPPHFWSFMRSESTLAVTNAASVYELPATFPGPGGLKEFTYAVA